MVADKVRLPTFGQVEPVVFTARSDVSDSVRTELKSLGVNAVLIPATQSQCIEFLKADSLRLLVIDWRLGSETVNQVIEQVRGHFKVETRPMLLIAPEPDQQVLATAFELGISQIHQGPISRHSIRESLNGVLREYEATRTIRESLGQVAKIRGQNNWTLATPILEHLLTENPGNDRLICELAENLIHEDGWDQALELIGPLTEREQPNIRALHLAGRCFMRKGDFDQAIGLLSRAKLMNPHQFERLIDLGDSYLQIYQPDEALRSFTEALAINGRSRRAKAGMGAARLLRGEVNEALSLMKDLSGPREMAAVFNMAAILTVRRKQFEQAMQLYQTAVQSIGKEDAIAARLLFNMGIGFRRWGKPDKAKVCFDRSLALDPSFSKSERQLTLLKGLDAKAAGKAAPQLEEVTPPAQSDKGDQSEKVDKGEIQELTIGRYPLDLFNDEEAAS
jgi:tetratricopeptide (TPR) repeat protein